VRAVRARDLGVVSAGGADGGGADAFGMVHVLQGGGGAVTARGARSAPGDVPRGASLGLLKKLKRQLERALEEVYGALEREVQERAVVYGVDETHYGDRTAWVVATESVTLYRLAASRGSCRSRSAGAGGW